MWRGISGCQTTHSTTLVGRHVGTRSFFNHYQLAMVRVLRPMASGMKFEEKKIKKKKDCQILGPIGSVTLYSLAPLDFRLWSFKSDEAGQLQRQVGGFQSSRRHTSGGDSLSKLGANFPTTETRRGSHRQASCRLLLDMRGEVGVVMMW